MVKNHPDNGREPQHTPSLQLDLDTLPGWNDHKCSPGLPLILTVCMHLPSKWLASYQLSTNPYIKFGADNT